SEFDPARHAARLVRRPHHDASPVTRWLSDDMLTPCRRARWTGCRPGPASDGVRTAVRRPRSPRDAPAAGHRRLATHSDDRDLARQRLGFAALTPLASLPRAGLMPAVPLGSRCRAPR